ncbi:MAG: cache domain-containing protein [Treponema sp.]|nr:cache domain-containing protein [Treponema sp.]
MSKKLTAVFILIFTFVSCAGLFVIADIGSKQIVMDMTKNHVENLLKGICNEVDAYNYSNFATIHIAATIPVIKDPDVSIKTKAEQLFGVKNADPNLVGLNITDLKGNSYLVEGPMYNFSERAYFKNALQGKETVFGPIINKVSKVPTIFYGAPHYDAEGNLINTFFLAAHGEILSKICERSVAGTESQASIVRRSTGLVIASVDPDKVLNANIFDDSADSEIKDFQKMTACIGAGESGFSFIKMPDGKLWASCYAPIEGTDWSVIVRSECKGFSDFINSRRLYMLIFSLMMLVTAVAFTLFLCRKTN